MNTLNGYSKSTLTDNNVLTASGGHIPLEELKANSAKILDNYFSTRPTTCDHLFGDGGLRSFKATSSMTTSKPPYDAHVLHFAWDNTSKWESQLALSTSSNPRLFIRSLNGANWSSWATLLGTNNYTEYVYSKTESDNKYLPKLRMTNPNPGHSGIGAIPFILALKAAGNPLYTDPEFAAKNSSGNYTNNSLYVYNNSGDNTVTITNIEDNQNSANSSGRILQISTTTGTARPGRGGFCQNMQSRAGAVFVQIFRAKIPEGYKVHNAENSMGKNYKTYWMTERDGTGKWEWYCRVTICGLEKATNSQGNLIDFGTGGHVYLEQNTPTTPLNVTWYLSYCNTFDLTKGNYDGLRTKYSDTADTVDGQHFNWNNNKNDHTYLWAASANGQAYLVHRASMSVNYANSAGSATSATSLSSWDVASSADTKRYIWMSHNDNSGKACYDVDLTYLTSTDTLWAKNIKALGDLVVGNTDANHTFSLQGSSSLLKLFAWGDATYIKSGNSDFSANKALKITGIGGSTGSDLYLNFSNIYCRANNYTNIDSGNIGSQSVNYANSAGSAANASDSAKLDGKASDSYFMTNRGDIPTTYIDLTDTTKNHTNYANYNSGTYKVLRTGYTDTYVIFRGTSSTSAIELLCNYLDGSRLKLRKTIDSNRVSGAWRELAFVSDIPTIPTSLPANGGIADGAYYVYDYNATTTPIYIGFVSTGLTSTTASHLAAYGTTSAGKRCIKDISASEAKKFIGLGNVTNYDLSKAIKSIERSGTTFTYTCLDGTTGTFTQQDNNSTYNVFGKTINADFKTAYRTLTKGNTSQGYYVAAIRNDTSSVADSPIYGTGLAFGMADTHGYLYMNYNTAEAYLGAGNTDKLNWVKNLAFGDGTGASGTWNINISGNAASASSVAWENITSKPTITDTKNTAGSTDTSSKIFLIGAKSQAANPQTYSHDTVYVDANGYLSSGLGMKVTGAAYFGGGTTYYFGSTGNINCNTLTAASTTILKGSFLLWNSTNSYISFYNNGKTSSNLVAQIHGMAGYNTTSATYTSGTNMYFRIFSSTVNGTTISTAGYYDYIFPNVPQGLTARTVHTIFTTQQSTYTLNGTGGATGDVSLTFWRGSNASWLLLNTGGNLRFKYNYYDNKVNTVYKDALVLNYNSGTVCSPTGFYEESDERLKDFYNDVEVNLEKLIQLPKKYFRWKRDPLELNIGTSAQEVLKLYPELVTQNDEGILSVAYDKLSIIALKGIDLLYKEIKELKVRIELLENK